MLHCLFFIEVHLGFTLVAEHIGVHNELADVISCNYTTLFLSKVPGPYRTLTSVPQELLELLIHQQLGCMDLTELDSFVHFYFREGLAASTWRTWKKFNQFCTEFNISNPLPVNQQTLCYYVAYLAKCNLSTIKVYLSPIQHYHIASNVPEPDRAKMQKLRIVSNEITY